MRRALELAARGQGRVEPNPPVGAVIVRGGEDVAAGWHGRFGGPHAEREALAAARRLGRDVAGATMYVTLEPCCHHGKTPPCTEAILDAGIARVVVAIVDPDERVAGRGIARLREAGVAVEVGTCEAEARALLAPYIKLRTRARPWVIGKWAQTADGYLALPPGEGRWISCEASRRRAHELRGLCDGICVGSGTLLADDPLLTNRSGVGRQPVRVVLDGRLRTPADCRLVRSADAAQPVIVATTKQALAARPAAAETLRRAGVEVLALPAGENGRGVAVPALLDELGRRQWTRLLIEGGAIVLRGVLDAGLADELWVFLAPRRLGPGRGDLAFLNLRDVEDRHRSWRGSQERCGQDTLRRVLTG